MKSRALVNKSIDKKIIWLMFLLVAGFSVFYIYLVIDSVSNIAAGKNNNEKIALVEAEVSLLEADYLAKIGEINADYATRLGFVDAAKSISYAVVGGQTVGLLSAKNEI